MAVREFSRGLALGGGTIAAREEKIAKFREDFKKEQGDDRTPEKVESDRLAIEEQSKRNELLDQKIQEGRSPEATPEAKKSGARAQGVKDGTITQAQADEATKRDLIGNPPTGYDSWAQYESETGIDADGDGKVSTKAEADEVDRIHNLMRVRPRRAVTRRSPIRRDAFPGITVPLGHPDRQT